MNSLNLESIRAGGKVQLLFANLKGKCRGIMQISFMSTFVNLLPSKEAKMMGDKFCRPSLSWLDIRA